MLFQNFPLNFFLTWASSRRAFAPYKIMQGVLDGWVGLVWLVLFFLAFLLLIFVIVSRYLVSVPDCRELLTPLYALLETRTQHYNQVLQLRGKLELLTRQTMDRQGDTVVDTEKQALLGIKTCLQLAQHCF